MSDRLNFMTNGTLNTSFGPVRLKDLTRAHSNVLIGYDTVGILVPFAPSDEELAARLSKLGDDIIRMKSRHPDPSHG